MNVYLDNAATTPIDKAVIDIMTTVMNDCYGNPSSIHAHGRKARTYIEKSRKKVAQLLGVAPGEICFTSGGTEADNMALNCAVCDLDCTHIITSKTEHHAVLYTAQKLEKTANIKVSYVNILPNGHIDIEDLEQILEANKELKTIVSLMHANNEIGNILDIEKVGELCKKYTAYFHTDTVQTIGHIPVKPKDWNVHFLAASAHKFNGPKGSGFIFIDESVQVKPFIYGGSQERNLRGGTENIIGIVGLAKAMDIAYTEMEEMTAKLSGLKKHMINRFKTELPSVVLNGDAEGRSNYVTLNVGFPLKKDADMMLFNLDIAGISASGGSACSSGSNIGSHVLAEIGASSDCANIRFSFGKYNNIDEIDFTVDKIITMFNS